MRESALRARRRARRQSVQLRSCLRIRPIAEALEPRQLLTAITSGQRILGNIGVAGEVDTFTFDASAHDSIAVVVGDTGSTNFFPKVQVLAPDNSVLASNAGQVGAGIDAQNLVQAGTYTISISDSSNTQVGSYAVSMFRTPTAQPTDADSGPITSGQRLTGSVDLGDLDVYTFTANAHDAVSLAVGDTGNTSFFPQMQVFGPDGQLVGNTLGQVGSGLDFSNLPQTGTYDVVIRHAGDNFSGAYALSMVRVPDTQVVDSDSGVLSSGQRVTGTIDLGDIDVYTFTANASDSLLLSIGDISNTSFFPELQVYDPDGAMLGSTSGQVGSGLEFHNLAKTGTYYAVVRQAGDNFTGNYALTMFRTPTTQPVDADSGPITSGNRVTGTIDLGDIDVYTFTANAHDSLALAIGDLGGTSFFPQLQLYGPDGALLGDTSGQVGTGLDLSNLTQTGTYYAVVRQAGDNFTGNYALTMFRTPTAQQVDTDSGPITSGQRLTGTIDLGDLDVYTFTANAHDSISLAIGDVAGNNFFPKLQVFAPDGTPLGSATGQVGAGLDLQNLPQTGTYDVLVRQINDDTTGQYALSLFRTGTTQITDADSGPLVSSQRRIGTIDLGDLDVYTFNANPGDSFSIAVGDPDGTSFFPELQVYRPDGSLLNSSLGQVSASVDATNVTQAGTYYVVVRQASDNFSGRYVLRMAQVPGTQQIDPLDGDGGPLASGQTRSGAISLADMDVYTFSLASGDNATVQLNRLFGNAYNPRLDVYSPTGALLASQIGTSSASVTLSNVLLSGTYFAVVRENGDDAVGNYSIALNAAPGPDTRAPTVTESRFDYNTAKQQVVFRINESVTAVSAGNLTLQNLTGNFTVPTANITGTFNAMSNEIVFQFPGYGSGILPDGNYHASIPAGAIADTAGNPLGAVSLDFFVLAGDANRDRHVDVTDLGILATNWQRAGMRFSQADFNYDGFVDVTDLGILATNWQKQIAPPSPAPVVSGFSALSRVPRRTIARDLLA